ncbi:MAG: cytidine deaminase [Flavobacteriales bacterium]|nr:cytidine deaminase [Flavobacteriales bacterium]
MKKQLEIVWDELKSAESLSALQQNLLHQARNAAAKAYAPYSHFFVGCALLLDNGEIVVGNNQENIAYPSGLCAERVAFFSAGAQHAGIPIKMAAISPGTPTKNTALFTPCGACRQAMAESEKRQEGTIQIIMEQPNGVIMIFDSVSNLLPLAFDAVLPAHKG